MIFLAVALPAEARPLIDRYRLRSLPSARAFRVYSSEHRMLVVTGVGRLAAAAGCGYLQGLAGSEVEAAWLNVGVGGHATRALGSCCLAHKVREAASGRCWYPPMLLDWTGDSSEVVTVDSAESAYPESVIYDMEASAFHGVAGRFATSELIHTVKVVSDNLQTPAAGLNKSDLTALISAALPAIDGVVEQLQPLASQLTAWHADPPGFQELLRRCRFTVSQRHQLRRILGQCATLEAIDGDGLQRLRADRAATVLTELGRILERTPVRISAP